MGDDGPLTAGKTLAKQLPRLRGARGWSQVDLAERLTKLGVRIHQATIAKIETGARKVSVDELLVFAYVLDVAPTHLLVPPWATPDTAQEDEPADDAAFTITAAVTASVHEVRDWVRGGRPLPGTNSQQYHLQIPRHEWHDRVRDLAERTGGEIRYIPREDG